MTSSLNVDDFMIISTLSDIQNWRIQELTEEERHRAVQMMSSLNIDGFMIISTLNDIQN